MLVTTQHTPQTSSNVLLLVVLLMPTSTTTTTTTTSTCMVMRFLLLWPSMNNKMTCIRRGFLKIAGWCRGAMFFSARHIGSLTPWTSIGHLRACQGSCPSRCFHGCELLPDTPPFIRLPLACGPNSKYQRTPERTRENTSPL